MKIRCAVFLGAGRNFCGERVHRYDSVTLEDGMSLSDLRQQVDSLIKQSPEAKLYIDPTDYSKPQTPLSVESKAKA